MAYVEPSVELATNGLDISVSGFNDSMPSFTIELFKTIKHFDIHQYEEKFKSVYENTLQKLENFKR
jgi:secreted Zn-dependent insulinase-like peptidase